MKTVFTAKDEVFVGQLTHLGSRLQVKDAADLLELLDKHAGTYPTLYYFTPDPDAPEGLREVTLSAGPDGWTQEQAVAVWDATADTLPDLYRRRWVLLSWVNGEAELWCQDYYTLLGNLEDAWPDFLTFPGNPNGDPFTTTHRDLTVLEWSFTMPAPANMDGYVPHVQPGFTFPKYI